MPAERRWLTPKLLYPLLVLVLSYFTYFRNYSVPPHFFWDENYHVAHAQKYLNRVFFMEPHPPLGKLLIALGEKLLNANEADDQFIGTDHGKALPKGFSFTGYRLFPVLLGWLTAPLIYLILSELTALPLLALLLSSFYLFDNAIIVHARGAMLESPQLFFICAGILSFLRLLKTSSDHKRFRIWSVVFGSALGCAVTTKITSLVLSLLVIGLLYQLRHDHKRLAELCLLAGGSLALVFVTVWQIHFSLGRNIQVTLPDQGYYKASERYKEILAQGQNRSLLNFPVMIRDSINFIGHYQKGAPALNLCKQEENGSPFYMWPIGARSINYRWESNAGKYQYLYLQANPVIWWTALAGLIVGSALVLTRFLYPVAEELKQPYLLNVLLVLYYSYMLAISTITRVMYLYHYFIPLIFSVFVTALVVVEIRRFGRWVLSPENKLWAVALWSAGAFGAFLIYSPLTYYRPLTNDQLAKRALLGIWDLYCVKCPRTNYLAHSTCDERDRSASNIFVSGLKAEHIRQDWDEPKLGMTVDKQDFVFGGQKFGAGIGAHAKSTIRFKVDKKYKSFSALVGLPDYLKDTTASVVFLIYGDGHKLWASPTIKPGKPLLPVQVDLTEVETLELGVSDAKDGIDNDHGCWLEPKLELKN